MSDEQREYSKQYRSAEARDLEKIDVLIQHLSLRLTVALKRIDRRFQKIERQIGLKSKESLDIDERGGENK